MRDLMLFPGWLTVWLCPFCDWSLSEDREGYDFAGVEAALQDHMSEQHGLSPEASVAKLKSHGGPERNVHHCTCPCHKDDDRCYECCNGPASHDGPGVRFPQTTRDFLRALPDRALSKAEVGVLMDELEALYRSTDGPERD